MRTVHLGRPKEKKTKTGRGRFWTEYERTVRLGKTEKRWFDKKTKKTNKTKNTWTLFGLISSLFWTAFSLGLFTLVSTLFLWLIFRIQAASNLLDRRTEVNRLLNKDKHVSLLPIIFFILFYF